MSLDKHGEFLLGYISEICSTSLSQPVKLEPAAGGGSAGGSGAQTLVVKDSSSGTKYFIKTASGSGSSNMLYGEFRGVKEMAETDTIKVPLPIAFGEYNRQPQMQATTSSSSLAFVVFEYLNFGSGGDEYEMGQQLAKMHRCCSPNGLFGFYVENTIGATRQPNDWMPNWSDFWDTHRLGHMLELTGDAGLDGEVVTRLRKKTKELLSQHEPAPSLLHGDLWGGNKGYARVQGKLVPVIFDPASYYGDREADIAMTYLFGGFGSRFYDGYNSEWQLSAGHEKRRTVYNLYHILNHEVLFGGYLGQAQMMVQQILRC